MLDSLQGRTTVFTGFGKGSGKTTALQFALAEARKAGSVAVFTIGYSVSGGKAQTMQIAPGDIVITTVALARATSASLNIIEAMPGRSAIGHLCIGRAVRTGEVALVGPEHFSQLTWAIDFVRENNLAKTVLVDGAGARITHAGALQGAQIVYCACVDAANFQRVAANIEMIAKLADLPVDDPSESASLGRSKLDIEGPLTASALDAVPEGIEQLSIETFSDCFLDPASFARASQRYKIAVRRRVPLLGFSVALKNVEREAFLNAVPKAMSRVYWAGFLEHGCR
jgi:hypothetical protein